MAVRYILARFDGHKGAAMVYCALMAQDYPRLSIEYSAYQNAIQEGL
jgi:hypothetical protein